MQTSQLSAAVRTETGEILDDSRALEHLETELGSDEDRNRIVGICNGLLMGAVVWILVFVAVIVGSN